MAPFRRLPATKLALAITATALVWQLYSQYGIQSREKEFIRLLNEERESCLVTKGLPSNGVMGTSATYSSLHCPVQVGLGDAAFPKELCTAHVIYLNHSEQKFVVRMPVELTSR